MTKESRHFQAGIMDFNPKRMDPSEIEKQGIPAELADFLADHRQYPYNIARHFPDNISWFDSQQPWFFQLVMRDKERVERLKQSDVLILSGSGLSAHRFQEDKGSFSPEDQEALHTSQDIVKSALGSGKWVLGICFGGQLAMDAVGAKIGRLPENKEGNAVTESGWLNHELTEAGKNDEVFGYLPDVFEAPHLHNDYISELPEIGSTIQTESGDITVTRAEVLAIRRGYLGTDGVEDGNTEYIHASVVEFDSGARLYQIQPHPEMATREKANFLVRQNSWLAGKNEMGGEYYQDALDVPEEANFSISEVITRLTKEARRHFKADGSVTFLQSAVTHTVSHFEEFLID